MNADSKLCEIREYHSQWVNSRHLVRCQVDDSDNKDEAAENHKIHYLSTRLQPSEDCCSGASFPSAGLKKRPPCDRLQGRAMHAIEAMLSGPFPVNISNVYLMRHKQFLYSMNVGSILAAGNSILHNERI